MFYSCVPHGFYFALRLMSTGRSAQTYEGCSNLIIFSRFSLFPQDFWQVKERLILKMQAWDDENVTFSFVPDGSHVPFWCSSSGRSAQIYDKKLFIGLFSRLDPFPQVFRHVNKWLILELHEIIRVSAHLVACPVFFYLLCNLRRNIGVLKLMRNAQF